jgi:spore maturation protein CgeB
MPKSLRGAIFGKHWEHHASLSHLYRGFVRYDELPSVYAESRLVIEDANHQTKAWGAANSRVFDSLAAGCLITKSQSVSDEVFDRMLPVYQSPEHLRELVSHYIHDTSSREALQNRLRETVLKQHCYCHRASEFKLKLQPSIIAQQGQH